MERLRLEYFLPHAVGAQRDPYADDARTEENGEERAHRRGETRKGREDGQNAEEYEYARAGHAN